MFGIPTFDLETDAGKQGFIEYIVNLTRKEIISYTPSYSASTVQANIDLTPYALSADLNAHIGDTTVVHGISDTANLVYTSDSRLTNARTPTAHASTHGVAGSDPVTIAPSQVTGTAVVTSDSRLSDARTPTTHATTHVPGGSDALDLSKLVGINAAGTTLPTLPNSLYPVGALYAAGTGAPYLLYRSTGSAWQQVGGGGGVTISDTAPSSPKNGDLWFKSSNGKTYVYYQDGTSNQWVEVGENAQVTIPGHSATHTRGGSDVIDGDRLTIDYIPTNYTRNSAASGAGDNTDLTAHLAGIDMLIPAGIIVPTAATTASNGWVFCYGQTVDSVANTTYARLYTAIGTTYGGTGASSFVIPDLRGRAPHGKDDMGGSAASRVTSGVSGIAGSTLGASGGNESMQSHYHNYYRVTTSGGTVNTGGDIIWAVSGGNVVDKAGSGYLRTDTAGSGTGSGSSQNMPPTIILNYMIKL